LWIAFKICIFDFQKQLTDTVYPAPLGCELLSKFVSLTFRNSPPTVRRGLKIVVNCFQNLYLWLSETAKVFLTNLVALLWIAFKICIFDFQKQRRGGRYDGTTCCELLSKFVSLTFRNSNYYRKYPRRIVVNCFQNLYLWLSETAKVYHMNFLNKLWIAFKICIFDFQKQQMGLGYTERNSCELLSKFVSLTFRNSLYLNW